MAVVARSCGKRKVCRRCGTDKHLYEFAVDRSRKDGRRYVCRQCDSDKYWAKVGRERERQREIERLSKDPVARLAKQMESVFKKWELQFESDRKKVREEDLRAASDGSQSQSEAVQTVRRAKTDERVLSGQEA